ncbi:MAG: hypothetical protein L6262_11720 [Weeksellaceae bacterium]|nr:hypothetical protein [Weeksellaceae bacterium]
MNKHKKKFWLAVPCVIIAIGLFVWFFQWLWNVLLPDILGVKAINYWQSFGLLLISKILFGGFSGDKRKFRGTHNFADEGTREMWKRNLESRFCGTDEEREKMKQLWKQKFESKFCKSESKPEDDSI